MANETARTSTSETDGTKAGAQPPTGPTHNGSSMGRAPVEAGTVVGGISTAARSAARGEGAVWTPIGSTRAVPNRAGWELVPDSVIGWIWRAAVAALASDYGTVRFSDEERYYSVRADGRLQTGGDGSGVAQNDESAPRDRPIPQEGEDERVSIYPSLLEVWRLKDQSRQDEVRVRVVSGEIPPTSDESD